MAFIVALTGGIGSGKSTVTHYFAELGVTIIDADIIAREIVTINSPALIEITQHFGTKILLPTGELNRQKLRQLIYSDENEKKWLENLLHPLIEKETIKQFNSVNNHTSYILWVVPLLIELNLQHHANRILVIDIAPEQQIIRTMKRDKLTRQQVEAIIATQISRELRLSFADDIINNNGNLAAIKAEVINLHHHYLLLASSPQSPGF